MYEQPRAQSNFHDVGDFHEKFGLDNTTHHDIGPRQVPDDVLEFRIKFMLEELQEFCEAVGFKIGADPTGQLQLTKFRQSNPGVHHALAFDALLDLAYVVFGTAHFMGYPWQMGWKLVQRANMAKIRAKADASDSKRGHALDVVKPAGWTPPNITDLLNRCGF